MTTFLVGYLVVGFGVSVYLLYTMGPARPGDTRWDRVVFCPELWVFAAMLWPLYVAIRVLRSRRLRPLRTGDQHTQHPAPGDGAPR